MKPTFLFFVRHGETEWNAQRRMMGITDTPLTKRGRSETKAIAKFLKDYRVDVIYSSPLNRTVSTAKAIRSGRKGVVFLLNDFLKERNFGVLEGKTYEEVNAFATPMQYGQHKFYPWFRPPLGESLVDLEERAKRFVEELRKHGGKNIVVVSHGAFLQVLFCTLLGLPLHEMGDFHFSNASLSIIEIDNSQSGRLHALNITRHLPEEL